MPTYEYQCAQCQHTWEAEQKVTDSPLVICQSCGAHEARRLISMGGGFVLRGNVWARDNYGLK